MNQKIKCEVHNCKYCKDDNVCELKEIKVCNCKCGESNKELTMCDSFKSRKSL